MAKSFILFPVETQSAATMSDLPFVLSDRRTGRVLSYWNPPAGSVDDKQAYKLGALWARQFLDFLVENPDEKLYDWLPIVIDHMHQVKGCDQYRAGFLMHIQSQAAGRTRRARSVHVHMPA